jgi:uncharacterized membrane-anchored protein
MRYFVVALGVLSCAIACGPLAAQGSKGLPVTAEEFEAKLGYRTGTISLPGGMATIRLPKSFRFLGQEGSRRLLTEGWGNPPEAAEGVLGMLIPAGISPLARDGWGIVITFEEDGYVDDSDAGRINYNKLLQEMQVATREGNEERRKQGLEPVTLIGWAEPPSYDAAAHKLYWAKELAFSGEAEHTLNYNIRILGRRGVLVLNAVSGMKQLPMIRKEARNILPAVEFEQGHRYQDYLPGKDKAAAYGITGLIVGATAAKVAAKVGLFKMIWLALLAFKKFAIAGAVFLAAAVKRLFTRKREEPGSPEQTA